MKLVYILPKFDLETDTHYFYLYDFIKKIADHFELTLLIEKSNSDIRFFDNVKNIKVQKFNRGILRVIENFGLILYLRLKGNKNFYIHYSQVSALHAAVIARLSGARTFYWNCGMMWLFGRKTLLKIILKLVTYLVTGVNILAEGYASHYKIKRDKIKIMPNWIDLARFENIDSAYIYKKYNLAQEKKYILFAHRLVKRKGAHYIAKIAEIFKNNKGVVFIIAGDGPYKTELRKDIENLDNVLLLGKIPNKDIPALMTTSSVFFMPSEEEGFPRVLLEAMAAGLPYVAFDIGGVREISSSAQQDFVVPLKNYEAMSQKLEILSADQVWRSKLAKNNINHVKQFDILRVVDIFIKLFDGS